ncbi:MAG: hypothetical protein IOC90_04200 [Methylocystis sp.]|nr:hypothetical protein [Methylocystis sp.]MCA3584419.1 hypothetical protein [Methylocystis sp.]MCA3587218.1 hypothetical protein [Methylocystis sp.]MCA3592560.1 hypothetical protein [Methylocystis sp.]
MRYILFVVTAMLSLCGPVHAVDPATGIDWEVKNRFRVVREHRHDVFMADFNSYFQRAAGRRGLDIPSGSLMRYPSPFRQNLPTHYLPEAAQYRHSWFHGDERDIIVRLAFRQEARKRCAWSVDGGRAQSAPCSESATLPVTLGTRQLSVKVDALDGSPPAERKLTIVVKDLKFVALGDSFASGEGNPHVTSFGSPSARLVEWWDHRCHRSLIGSSAQAAVALAQQRRDTSVTYVSFACSGATIDAGILKPYAGRETAEQARDRLGKAGIGPVPHFEGINLPPQMDRVEELLCAQRVAALCLRRARPDILVITTGGNELDFGPLVARCASGGCTFPKAEMDRRFAQLDRLFASLAERVKPLDAVQVYLSGYLDMTRNERGRFCGDQPFDVRPDFVPSWLTVFGFGIARAEARDAYSKVLKPLEERLSRYAGDYGWVNVADFRRDRGFCARPGWFHTYAQARDKQGFIGVIGGDGQFLDDIPTGAMHPNLFGHAEVAGRLLKAVQASGQ